MHSKNILENKKKKLCGISFLFSFGLEHKKKPLSKQKTTNWKWQKDIENKQKIAEQNMT